MSIPMKSLIDRLKERKFLKPGTKLFPTSIPHFIPLPIKNLLIIFRSFLNGYINYYRFADNIGALKTAHHIFRSSLTKTIQRKLDISRGELIRIFGQDISLSFKNKLGKIQVLDFKCPPLPREPNGFKGTKP